LKKKYYGLENIRIDEGRCNWRVIWQEWKATPCDKAVVRKPEGK
jgi:hypothetical protein